MSQTNDPTSLLRDLIAAPSPSGYEQPVQEVFRRACEGFVDSVETDVIGNTYAILKGDGGKHTVMLAGHCDEIGFQVTYVNSEGYIYFDPIGGHDANITVGQRVLVHSAEHGALPGMVGKKPIHVLTEEERGRKTVIGNLFIDIGAMEGFKVDEIVRIGDPITYAAGFERLRGDLLASHAFDNKIGVFVVAETMRLLAEHGGLKATVYGVSTVQEEIGHRGAKIAAHKVNADIGIAIDVCHATDYPGSDKRHIGDVRLGGGPESTRGPNINPEVFRRLVAAAEAEKISLQIVARPAATRTDAADMQVNRNGMATALISIPLRYMHTPCEVIAFSDAVDSAKLLARFILDLDDDADFIPNMSNLPSPRLPLRRSTEPSKES